MSVKVKYLPNGNLYQTKVDAFKAFNSSLEATVANKAKFFQQHKYDFEFLNEAFQKGKKAKGVSWLESTKETKSSCFQLKTDNIQFEISLTIQKQQEKIHISSGTPNKDVGREIWNLEKMNLIQECSDFYVLYDLTIDHSDDAFLMSMFNSKRDYLAKQFSSYLDMAIGGELRHCKNFSTFFSKTDNFYWETNRHQAWEGWRKVRNQQGIDAIKTAFEAFDKGKWSMGYGGKTWAKATQVLLRFLTGEDTATMFVDTIWSLQHNTTYILDKFWNINGLAPILNGKFNGEIKNLVLQNKCSSEVAQIYRETNHLGY